MRIKIKNLARIKEASVALKPLTIFIGKNNTNKSYVAHVFYALLDLASVRWRHVEKNISEIIEKEYIKETVEQLKPFLEKTEEKQDGEVFYVFSLKKDEKCLTQLLQVFKKLWTKIFPLYIKNPTLKKVVVEMENLSLSNFLKQYEKIPQRKFVVHHEMSIDKVPSEILFDFFFNTIFSLPLIYFNFRFPPKVFYFPASRTGFALALEDIISGIVRRLSGMSGTKLTEPTIDFLKAYNDIKLERFKQDRYFLTPKPKKISADLQGIINFFEKKLLNGKVILKKPPKSVETYSRFVYKPYRFRSLLEFHCVSSLVTELAPLYSFLNELRDIKNTLFIIEEPESHLHPSAQLEIVKFLSMLVRSKAKVLITTHSDHILNFVNVLIRSSQLEDKDRKKLKLEKCFLNPEEVGCYLFKEKGKDVEVKELEVSNNGVTTESFEEVLDEIIGLSSKIHKLLYKEFIKK